MNIYILRGGSGAGKSTWVKKNHTGADIVSADHFFTNADGDYNFEPAKLGEAHAQSLRTFVELCQAPARSGFHTLIADNTNTTLAEFGPYAQVGLAYNHNVQIVTFIYDPIVAYARNTHGTPLKACIEMHARLIEHSKLIPPWWKHDYVLSQSV